MVNPEVIGCPLPEPGAERLRKELAVIITLVIEHFARLQPPDVSQQKRFTFLAASTFVVIAFKER